MIGWPDRSAFRCHDAVNNRGCKGHIAKTRHSAGRGDVVDFPQFDAPGTFVDSGGNLSIAGSVIVCGMPPKTQSTLGRSFGKRSRPTRDVALSHRNAPTVLA